MSEHGHDIVLKTIIVVHMSVCWVYVLCCIGLFNGSLTAYLTVLAAAVYL